ncbi:MAG: DNA repair protein RecO [Chloroflexi bacterium]|nr:DNA repair protein RecO [Chloroflexota bacterium]MXX83818.1 DNA repair protein RecO [Chloroflexota bacterium]MYA92901.1 DNA repair protein RecO [Chloroflexota bacterium]MYD37973.1 DNA repair protein RecO [Chloroflexota bacterium]MYH65460.1 DNA repair protein RecO [Chloroflexota bacterium]
MSAMPRPSRSFRSQVIILSRRDFGEADRLLTLLTPAHGKLRAIAKGARKPNAKLSGHVELFARSDCLLHRGRNLAILTQAELIEPYLGLRDDLQRGAYASYAAELLDRFTADDEEDAGALFALLDDTLQRIATARDARLAIRFYELALLELAGFMPELSECVITRQPLAPEAQFFSCDEGGVVSRAARSLSQSRTLPIKLDTLKLLRYLQRSADNYAAVESLRLRADEHQRAERLMLAYITHLLERRLVSVAFLERLRKSS